MSNIQLSVVMPVYNEEGAIGGVLIKWAKEFRRLGISFQIHVYNDGSTDNTLAILNKIAEETKELVIHNEPNRGHGPTILKGYRENSDAEWIFQIDSDDEIGTEWFEDLWRNTSGHDFLLGNRNRPRQPLSRKIVSCISRVVVKMLYGNKVCDVNSPYRLMKGRIFKKVFRLLPDTTFAPNVIISGVVSLRNLRCYEIAVDHQERTTGEVSIKKWKLFKASVKSLLQTISCRYRVVQSRFEREE